MAQRRFAAPTGRMHDGDDPPRMRRELTYALAALAFFSIAAIVWNMFGASAPPPRIAPPTPAYKIAPPAELAAPDAAESSAIDSVMEGEPIADGAVRARPGPEAPLASDAGAERPQLSPAPRFVSNGPYVAQLAALQSEAAVQPAWARLSARAPALFGQAQLDVERADLGQNGVYYRVRAGYFANREEVARFCDRIRQLGQDCIAVRR